MKFNDWEFDADIKNQIFYALNIISWYRVALNWTTIEKSCLDELREAFQKLGS